MKFILVVYGCGFVAVLIIALITTQDDRDIYKPGRLVIVNYLHGLLVSVFLALIWPVIFAYGLFSRQE